MSGDDFSSKNESRSVLLDSLKPDQSVMDLDIESTADFFRNDTVQSISWDNIEVKVKSRKTGHPISLLTSCSGLVEQGEVLALMGPSGSGKSTMLNILANRSKLDHSGNIMVNKSLITGSQIRNISSYVQQHDVNIGGLTVRESVAFTSQLATSSMSKEQQTHNNSEVIQALGLDGQSDTIISSPLRACLSGGQKRRLSLATALVTGPKILFLDEPTSGLDSAASYQVIKFVSRFAIKYNLIVILSIHQPAAEVLNIFDQVMMISKGHTCYYGPTKQLRPYFDQVAPIPHDTNPAEYLLTVINTDFLEEQADLDKVERIIEAWSSSKQLLELAAANINPGQPVHFVEKQRAPFLRACWILLQRSFIKSYRDPFMYGTRLVINAGLAFVTGTVWLRLSYGQSFIQPFINSLFFSSAFMSLMGVAYAPSIIEDIRMFEKEYADRLYKPLPFTIANFIVGLPWLGLVAFFFSIIVYFLSNLDDTANRFATFLLWLFMDLLAAESLVVLVCVLVPEFVSALAIIAFANGLWLAVGGFLVPKSLLNSFWKYAFHYIDYQTYVFQGLMVNQFSDTIYECAEQGDQTFCMYPSDLAAQGQIRGTAILDAYGYSQKPRVWLHWLGYTLAIIFAHRMLGFLALCWRARR